MHLTPEQIDRQPFRMTKRGYDIVQVRNFLREIADEMRERQGVREQLAADGEADAVVEEKVHHLIEDARREADEIVAAATARAGSMQAADDADQQARSIVENAETEASTLVEDAERRAVERSDEVLSEAQTRLDQLLEQERELTERIESMRSEIEPRRPLPELSDSRDVLSIVEIEPDTSFADFMKSTLRHELHPD